MYNSIAKTKIHYCCIDDKAIVSSSGKRVYVVRTFNTYTMGSQFYFLADHGRPGRIPKTDCPGVK